MDWKLFTKIALWKLSMAALSYLCTDILADDDSRRFYSFLACMCHVAMLASYYDNRLYDKDMDSIWIISSIYPVIFNAATEAVRCNNEALGSLSIILMTLYFRFENMGLAAFVEYSALMNTLLIISVVFQPTYLSVFFRAICVCVPLSTVFPMLTWINEFNDKYEIGNVVDLVSKKSEHGHVVRVSEQVRVEFKHLSSYLKKRYNGMHVATFLLIFCYQQLGILFNVVDLFRCSVVLVTIWIFLMLSKWQFVKTILRW